MQIKRPTAYDQIAEALRSDILRGVYEPTDDDPARNELPGAMELGQRYGVSDKTAARAVQQLVTEGLVRTRAGLRPIVVPQRDRPNRWPMDQRYARAREAGGLVWGQDMQGREVIKQVTATGWTAAPDAVADLLRLDPDSRVWTRARRMLVGGAPAELSVSYFPSAIAEGTELTTDGPYPQGGVIRVLESLGHEIISTYNEVRSRLATSEELDMFGPDPGLAPLRARLVLEIAHVTYGADDEPLEAVLSVRPADRNVIIFRTYEGPAEASSGPSATDRHP